MSQWVTGVLMASTIGAGCSLDVTFDESRYRCEPPATRCPTGYACSDRGYCEINAPGPRVDAAVADDAGDSDASLGGDEDAALVDAAVIDAPVRPIDAAIPDAAPPDANDGPITVALVASRDTRLHGGDRQANFGATAELVCNGNPDTPVLIGWNLSGIPTTAAVDSAVMRLSTGDNALQGEGASVSALLEDWSEGNKDGQTGTASYEQRKSNTSWSAAGARPPSRSGVLLSFAPTTPNKTFDVPLPQSLVQSWVDVPAGNFGLIITCPFSNDVSFHSRSVSSPPVLVVTYRL